MSRPTLVYPLLAQNCHNFFLGIENVQRIFRMSAGHTNRSQKSCVSLTTQFTTKLQRGGANPLGSSVLLLGLESQFVRASIGTASQLTHSLADALPPVLCYGVHCCSLATYISFWMNRKHIGGARKVWDAGWL